MKRLLFIISVCMTLSATEQTLEECQRAAERNYPLIAQHDLIAGTTDLTVANIQKGWLPQLTATAQATYQSAVPAWPNEMEGLMQQMGIDMKGLAKDQYRVGLVLQQTVFDGGAISAQKRVAVNRVLCSRHNSTWTCTVCDSASTRCTSACCCSMTRSASTTTCRSNSLPARRNSPRWSSTALPHNVT